MTDIFRCYTLKSEKIFVKFRHYAVDKKDKNVRMVLTDIRR